MKCILKITFYSKKTNLENLIKVYCNFEKDLFFEPLQCLTNASN